MIDCTPPFRWAGGKRRLIQSLVGRFPPFFRNYHEVFFGAGALFFSYQPTRAILADSNPYLVRFYRGLQKNPEAVIKRFQYNLRKCSKAHFTHVTDTALQGTLEQCAGDFFYLINQCYGAVWRTTQNGRPSITYCPTKRGVRYDRMFANLRLCSKVIKKAEIHCRDFSEAVPKKEDFVYFDPPYYATRLEYAQEGFDYQKHIDLSDFCKSLDKQGVFFMLSNSDTTFTRSLYKGFNISNVEITYATAHTTNHTHAKELIVTNYES